MGNAADTLVSKNPTRVLQLKGPVLAYLKAVSASLPFNGTDQDLYLSVFYPAYRRKPINMALPSDVQAANPGIKTPGDYIALVNKQKLAQLKDPAEWTALKDTASAIGMSWEPLYKLINFESGWDPMARNPSSGARGLIQFMPKTAEGMGYKAGINIVLILAVLAAGYLAARKYKLIP